MEFSFKGKLARQLGSETEMLKAFGRDRAKALQRRLGVLRNARTWADVPTDPPTRYHALKGDRQGQFAVVLIANWRLVFEPDPPVQGHVDRATVRRIGLLEVVDYHGE